MFMSCCVSQVPPLGWCGGAPLPEPGGAGGGDGQRHRLHEEDHGDDHHRLFGSLLDQHISKVSHPHPAIQPKYSRRFAKKKLFIEFTQAFNLMVIMKRRPCCRKPIQEPSENHPVKKSSERRGAEVIEMSNVPQARATMPPVDGEA